MRLVAKRLSGSTDVGKRVADIPAPLSGVLRRLPKVKKFGEQGVGLVQRVTLPAGDVEYLPCHLVGIGVDGKQIGLDSVVHIGEIAALLSISEDGWTFATHHLQDELRNDTGIGRVGHLPGAKDVEVAQAHRLQAIDPPVRLHVKLTHDLLRWIGCDG